MMEQQGGFPVDSNIPDPWPWETRGKYRGRAR